MPKINQQLCDLLRVAQGERSQNQFALQCGISSAALSKIHAGNYAPTAKALKKIAAHAHNNVSYQSLLNASGLVDMEDLNTAPLQWTEEEKAAGVVAHGVQLSSDEWDWLELRSEIISAKGEKELNAIVSLIRGLIKK